MSIASIKETLSEDNPDAYIYEGMDDAIIGLTYENNGPILAYSFTACIDIFIERDSMSLEEAVDFFYFNIAGLILGENQPIMVYDFALFWEKNPSTVEINDEADASTNDSS